MTVGIGSIKLSDVTEEIGLIGQQGLLDCFTAATGTFNATYEGSKDRLSNFQGYEHTVTYNSFLCYQTGLDSKSPCTDPNWIGVTRYSTQTSIATSYSNNVPIYSDAGTTLATAGYYHDGTLGTWYSWNGTSWTGTATC